MSGEKEKRKSPKVSRYEQSIIDELCLMNDCEHYHYHLSKAGLNVCRCDKYGGQMLKIEWFYFNPNKPLRELPHGAVSECLRNGDNK